MSALAWIDALDDRPGQRRQGARVGPERMISYDLLSMGC